MLALPLLTTLLAAVSSAAIQLQTDPQGQHYFRVVGGADGTIAVFVAANQSSSAMLGEQSRAGSDLLFTPRFALQPGLQYRVEFTAQSKVTASFRIDAPTAPAGFLERIYPSANQLPENQLKLYLHFATPMARGEIYRHVHLLDAEDREIEQPFLELGEELWDREQQRLTLLFDPGRVKRDLVPNREVGTPLQAGNSYTLVVDAELRDATGQKLKQEYRKRFTVGAADRQSPQPGQWRIEAPPRGSQTAVAVMFPEPLDRALLLRSITVEDASGALIAGTVSVDQEERRWQFTPQAGWQPGRYRLVIATTLEDLAGNRIGRLFDEDTSVPGPRTDATVSLTFGVAD
jgi:hypothetical protein